MSLHRDVEVLDRTDERVLYHSGTGRWVQLHGDTLARLDRLPPMQARLDRLGMLESSPQPDADWVPQFTRSVLQLPDEQALWLPDYGRHGPGGHPWYALRLGAEDWAVAQAIDDRRTVAQVASASKQPVTAVLKLCRTLCGPQVQALQLRPAALPALHPGRDQPLRPERDANLRTEDQHLDDGGTHLVHYHLTQMDEDGERHFDDRETTVAHALEWPHPALGGRSYGAALAQHLAGEGLLGGQGWVIELGCGTGAVARDLCAEAGIADRYLRVDLSPALLAYQRQQAPETRGLLADITRLPLADASVQTAISNEVLADLAAVSPARDGARSAAARAWLERLGVPVTDAPVNLGALQLVEELARVLAPGGHAWLSEFGHEEGDPEEATQLDHPEVSIDFGLLQRAAALVGLHARLTRLDDALGADLGAQHVDRAQWHGLRALAHREGVRLSARCWTPAQLEQALPVPVGGLRFVPLSEPGPGPLITRFWALSLHKPATPDQR